MLVAPDGVAFCPTPRIRERRRTEAMEALVAFNLRKFLSQLRVQTLEQYLRASYPQVAASMDWAAPPERLQATLAQTILGQPSGRENLLPLLERIHLIANERGDRAMTAACGMDLELRRCFHAHLNSHERALWLFAEHEPCFERAEEIRDADAFWGSGRRWTGFVGPRDRWPVLAGEELDLFKARVETSFRRFDGSGASIVVDVFERGPTHTGRQGEGRVCQIVVYLEGLPSTSTEFSEGAVVRRSLRPAVEVVLVYAPDTGAIDVVAKAGKDLREAVARAFVEELFPVDAAFEPVRLREVNLSGLAAPTSFPVDPEDGISSVRLVLLRFAPNGADGRITLETSARTAQSLNDAAQRWFGANNPLRRAPAITKVKLAIRFEPRPGQRRGRSLPVELTWPHGCNLRDRSDQERLVGEKYLRRWHLVRDV
jgi:hypothetical protein